MDELVSARISAERGVGSDSRGKPGRRQVTVLTRRGWEEACADLGAPLPWTARRANLFVEGLDLHGKVGYELRIGEVVLTISGETIPCKVMEEAKPGLMSALKPQWRGGVTCRVTRPGDVAVGSEVALQRNVVRQLGWVAYERGRRAWRKLRGRLGRVARALGLRKARPVSAAASRDHD